MGDTSDVIPSDNHIGHYHGFRIVSSLSVEHMTVYNEGMTVTGIEHMPERSRQTAEHAVQAGLNRLAMVGVSRRDAIAKMHAGLKDALDTLVSCGLGSAAHLKNQASVVAHLYDTEVLAGQEAQPDGSD